MLALAITLVPIVSKATSYTSDDSVVISEDIHSFFNNYFSYKDSYLYFPYSCDTRTCYYGINQDNEYVNIIYNSSGSYNYTREIITGVDDNFSVTGDNVFYKDVSVFYILLLSFVFFAIIKIIDSLIGGGYRVQ